MGQDPAERILVVRAYKGRDQVGGARQQFRQLIGELANGQDEIRNLGGDGTAGHGGIFRLARILDEDDAARLLDRLDADGAIGACTGENDREPATLLFGKRPKKQIDRRAMRPRFLEGKRRDGAVGNLQPTVRRNHVDVIAFQPGFVIHLRDRHLRPRGQNTGELAPGIRIEVNDDDESRVGVGWDAGKEGLECLNAPCRSSDSDNRRI